MSKTPAWTWTTTPDGFIAEHDGLSIEVIGYDNGEWIWLTWNGSLATGDSAAGFESADEAKADAEAYYAEVEEEL